MLLAGLKCFFDDNISVEKCDDKNFAGRRFTHCGPYISHLERGHKT